jgi:hypothetical protein
LNSTLLTETLSPNLESNIFCAGATVSSLFTKHQAGCFSNFDRQIESMKSAIGLSFGTKAYSKINGGIATTVLSIN